MLIFFSVRITWKPEYAGPSHLSSLPHRALAVAELIHLFFCNSITDLFKGVQIHYGIYGILARMNVCMKVHMHMMSQKRPTLSSAVT